MKRQEFDAEMYRVMLPALVSRFENTILTELMASEVKVNRKKEGSRVPVALQEPPGE